MKIGVEVLCFFPCAITVQGAGIKSAHGPCTGPRTMPRSHSLDNLSAETPSSLLGHSNAARVDSGPGSPTQTTGCNAPLKFTYGIPCTQEYLLMVDTWFTCFARPSYCFLKYVPRVKATISDKSNLLMCLPVACRHWNPLGRTKIAVLHRLEFLIPGLGPLLRWL
jgi:hypothetical protein